MSNRNLFEEIKEGFDALAEREQEIRRVRKYSKPQSKRARIVYSLIDGASYALGHIFTVSVFLVVLFFIFGGK